MKTLPADKTAINAAAELVVKSLLAGIDSAAKEHRFAEVSPEDIERLPFEEAVAYLQKKEILPAEKYYALSDKARFRAFTLSLIADGDMMKRVKNALAENVLEGAAFKVFYKKLTRRFLRAWGFRVQAAGFRRLR